MKNIDTIRAAAGNNTLTNQDSANACAAYYASQKGYAFAHLETFHLHKWNNPEIETLDPDFDDWF